VLLSNASVWYQSKRVPPPTRTPTAAEVAQVGADSGQTPHLPGAGPPSDPSADSPDVLASCDERTTHSDELGPEWIAAIGGTKAVSGDQPRLWTRHLVLWAAASRRPKGVAEDPMRTTSPPPPLWVDHETRRRPVNGFDALPELMTMDQLAERLGVTHRHVRRLVDERRVPFLRVGRFIRFDPLHRHPRKASYVQGRVMGTGVLEWGAIGSFMPCSCGIIRGPLGPLVGRV
jgi:excisionase family DNA binding protein